MRRSLSALLAASMFVLGVSGFVSSNPRAVPVPSESASGPMCVASAEEPMLGCGEIHCTRDADCPSTCGGCITWSGTCALFAPR